MSLNQGGTLAGGTYPLASNAAYNLNLTLGNITCMLPATPAPGDQVQITVAAGVTTNSATVLSGGTATVNGQASVPLAGAPSAALLLIYDGVSNWGTVRTFARDADWHVVGNRNEPAFKNGWAHFAGPFQFSPARFRKDEVGCVHLDGMVNTGTLNQPIFTLPPGYRPAYAVNIPIITSGDVRFLGINPNGDVIANWSTGGWLSLSSVHFMAEDVTPPTWANIPLTSPWTNYGVGNAPARYCIDAVGDVHLSGTVTASGNPVGIIGTLPANARSTHDSLRIVACNGGYGARVDLVAASGTLGLSQYATNSNSGWVSLEGISYSTDSTTRWLGTTIGINSWTNYGGNWPPINISKNANGLVRMKGLITAGTAGASILNMWITRDFRPGAGMLFPGWATNGTCRLDVNDSSSDAGNLMVQGYTNGGTNGYVSLEGMQWWAR
jgi:hypothetical protein